MPGNCAKGAMGGLAFLVAIAVMGSPATAQPASAQQDTAELDFTLDCFIASRAEVNFMRKDGMSATSIIFVEEPGLRWMDHAERVAGELGVDTNEAAQRRIAAYRASIAGLDAAGLRSKVTQMNAACDIDRYEGVDGAARRAAAIDMIAQLQGQ